MKIKFRKSGGYAGLISGCEIDTNSLPPDQAQELDSLVKRSGILSAGSARSEAGRDLGNYHITVTTDEGTHQVSFDDMTAPESARALLEYLMEHSGPRPPD